MSEPDATVPDATAPDATAPDATAPDATGPDATGPDEKGPDATESGSLREEGHGEHGQSAEVDQPETHDPQHREEPQPELKQSKEDAKSGPSKRHSSLGVESDVFEQDFEQDENLFRGNWTGRFDFLLSCLGYAVGLGNVWRFPYLCYKHGGAVFLIPYVIMLFLVGIPIFFMELSIGQFTSSGPLTCWQLAPMFKGIGVAMVTVSALVAIYYNVIIAWAIYYFFASMSSPLPWTTCNPKWSSEFCVDDIIVYDDPVMGFQDCKTLNYTPGPDGVCYNYVEKFTNKFGFERDYLVHGIWNKTRGQEQMHPKKALLASEDYFRGYSLGIYYSGGVDNLREPKWDVLLCLLLAWIIVALSLIKGVKSSGKVVYFTALFPYVVLIILLINGVLREGHYQGVEFYILKADVSKLKDATVWKDAAVQIFFSLSASWGGLIALSSYNRFHNNCLHDAIIVSISNCLTSFFAGFVVFSYLGFLAHELNTTVDAVVSSGPGLVFVVYPAALARMKGSTAWSILFFLMLITLGLDSQFALVETVATSLIDQFPWLHKRKYLFILALSGVLFLLGLTMTTYGGVYLLQIMDHYSGGWNVMLIALFECACVMYVYSFKRFKEDVRIMIGEKVFHCVEWSKFAWVCAVMWGIITPGMIIFLLIFSWVKYEEVTYGSYVYPSWAPVLGWLMTLVVVCGLLVTPIVMAVYQKHQGEELIDLIKPTQYWGPALPKHRRSMASYLNRDNFKVNPWIEGK